MGMGRIRAVLLVLLASALGGAVSDPGEQLPFEEQEVVQVPHQDAVDSEMAGAADDEEPEEAADDEGTADQPEGTPPRKAGIIQGIFDTFKSKLEEAGSEAVSARMEVIASLRVGTPVECRDTKEGILELKKMLPDEMFPHVIKEVEWYKQWKASTAKHAQEKRKNHEKLDYMGAVVTHAQAQAQPPPEKFVYFVRPPDTTDCTVDGRLTAGALKQAREMLEKFPPLGRAEVIITSPLARSLETALLVFQGHRASNLSQIVLDPNLDEVGSVNVYKQGKGALFDLHRQDVIPSYHLLWGDTNPHELGFHTTAEMPQLRWNHFVKSLARRPEKFIVVFTHKAMMETNLGEVPDDGKYVMRLLRNGQLIRVLPPGESSPPRSALVSPAKQKDQKAMPHSGKDEKGALHPAAGKNQKGKPSPDPKSTLVSASKHKPDKGSSEKQAVPPKKSKKPTPAKDHKEANKNEGEKKKKKSKLLLQH